MKRRDFVTGGALPRAALVLARAGILTRPKARQEPRQHVFRASRISRGIKAFRATKCSLLHGKLLSGSLLHESAFYPGGKLK
jgi:hypothetical protein